MQQCEDTGHLWHEAVGGYRCRLFVPEAYFEASASEPVGGERTSGRGLAVGGPGDPLATGGLDEGDER